MERRRILFIGNSHTYFNDMVSMFQHIAEEATGAPVDITMLAHPGRTLEEHMTEPEVRFNILCGGYDTVVLQQAAHPFPGREALFRGASAIHAYVKQAGARTALYMTWAEKRMPGNQQAMAESYAELAKALGAALCPVGLSWQHVLRNHPEIELYDGDGEHASVCGSYLAACVFCAALTGKSPVGLPGTLTHRGRILCDIPEDTARILQEAAAAIIPHP
jgi:hypothetical protein